MSDTKRLTTSHGMPLDNDLQPMTAGQRTPTLVQDLRLVDNLVTHMKTAQKRFSFAKPRSSTRQTASTGNAWSRAWV